MGWFLNTSLYFTHNVITIAYKLRIYRKRSIGQSMWQLFSEFGMIRWVNLLLAQIVRCGNFSIEKTQFHFSCVWSVQKTLYFWNTNIFMCVLVHLAWNRCIFLIYDVPVYRNWLVRLFANVLRLIGTLYNTFVNWPFEMQTNIVMIPKYRAIWSHPGGLIELHPYLSHLIKIRSIGCGAFSQSC